MNTRGTRSSSRRTFLLGAGGLALAIPLLEYTSGRAARAAGGAPQRFLIWNTPNGTVTDNWRPVAGATGAETDFQLSQILAPMQAHKDDLVVVQHLSVKNGYAHENISSMTGYRPGDAGYPNLYAVSPSVDQYLVQKLNPDTAVASLQLGITMPGSRDTAECLSWSGSGKALPAEINPYLTFSKLFGNGQSDPNTVAEIKRTLARKRSMLDSLLAQEKALAKKLGTSDRAVLAGYFQSVRDLEARLTALDAAQKLCVAPMVPADPSASGEAPFWMQDNNSPAMMDLYRRIIVAAFTCDLTRVVSYNLAGGGGNSRFNRWIPGIDHGGDWHGHSHNVELGDRASLSTIHTWYYGELAKLVADLKAVTGPDGKSLLYNCLIWSTSEYGSNGPVDYLNGNNNSTHNQSLMPFVLVGQAAGKLKTGRNLVYPFRDGSFNDQYAAGTHHTKLLVSMLNLMGVPDATFGDPAADQGPLVGIV